jgi:hypothetical protein
MATITVVDTTPPVITLNGADPQEINSGTPYVELGASATDISGGILTGDIVVDASAVNTAVIGSYPVTYNVSDGAGYAAIEVTRTVDILFGYELHLQKPKGNIRAGSTVPLDWYYTVPGSSVKVDSLAFPGIVVSWLGPYSQSKCGGENQGDGDGSEAEDSGSSGFRYSDSQKTWQYSWQTPELVGSYQLVISPPGSEETWECVTLR